MSRKIPYRYAFPLLIACVTALASVALLGNRVSAQDNPRTSDGCLVCHEGKDATLAPTAHSLAGHAGKSSEPLIACTDCHKGDHRHWEEDPTSYPMNIPANLDPRAEAKLCSQCHETSHQQNMLEKNIHPRSGINCSGCHTVHASMSAPLLKKPQPELCLSCHPSVRGDFARSYRHPVDDHIVKCSECHVTLDQTRRELSFNGTNVCTKCHAEFQGPFPYEHPATLDFSTEEGGCLSCHAAHGSDNPRMLKQPYEPPHYQLCTQCHTVPRHNSNMEHGTRWAGMACNTCHTEIHGSYTSPNFLSESLESQGCFKVGCHGGH